MASLPRALRLLCCALWLSVLVGQAGAATTYRMQGLLGGSINWAVDPDFALGSDKRFVTFVMNTTMTKSTSCTYTPGDPVDCNHPSSCGSDGLCAVGEMHGVLCIAQLYQVNGARAARWAVVSTTGDEAQCVHDHILLTEASTVFPTSPAATSAHVGKVNKMVVEYVYDQVASTADTVRGVNPDRKPSGTNAVQGTLSHRVRVHDDAQEVMAWLAPRKGYRNMCRKTSTLLEPCPGSEVKLVSGVGAAMTYNLAKPTFPCMANPESLLRSNSTVPRSNQKENCAIFQGPALDPLYDAYWGTSNFGWTYPNGQAPCANVAVTAGVASPAAGCMRPVTPALETLVPLCSMATCPGTPPRNYFSPEVTMPHIVEVAITPKTLANAAWAYAIIDDVSQDAERDVIAPHAGFYVHSVDYDGHKMTQSSPLLKYEMQLSKAALVGPYGGKWGIGDSTAAGVTTRLSLRVDCILSQADPAGRWPLAPTPTGCRELFDFDRNATSAKGNLLRADFAFSALVGASNLGNLPMMFTQHVINTVDFPFDDVDNTAETQGTHIVNNPSLSKGAAMTQNVFSMFGCNAGTANQPPRFVSAFDSEDTDVQTVYRCNFWEECAIQMYARDFVVTSAGAEPKTADGKLTQSPDKLVIRHAFSFTKFPEGELSACSGVGRVDCKFVLTSEDPAMFDKSVGRFRTTAVGKVFVRCFLAYDTHISSEQKKTCPSMPHCVKIKIDGRKPQFVSPTPLGPSYDDNGLLVPNRHDVPACEGYALPLIIKAEMSLPATASILGSERAILAGKPVRIYLEDKDVDPRLRTGCPGAATGKYSFLGEGGRGNPDFFCDAPLDLTAQERLDCGDFGPYYASQTGPNVGQPTIAPLVKSGDAKYKTVNSAYTAGVAYTAGAAQVEVVFFPKVDPSRNGITLRAECDAHDNVLEVNCREKLVNMDQVICASAYDGSRVEHKRWVGERDPNGDDIFKWQRDHSNGDVSSDMHCWRVRIAAPPVFVTDPEGELTPFVNTGGVTWRDIVDSTGNRLAYKLVRFRVGQFKSLTFLAQDPNPGDSVEVLILADPGIPEGMEVSESVCIGRTGDQAMCKAKDVISTTYPREDWSATFEAGQAASRCSRAYREISLNASAGLAGEEFKVCAVARDDSSICFGQGPEMATARGWFGEQQCIIIQVAALQIRWINDVEALGTDVWEVKAYVGCASRIRVGVYDDLMGGAGDPYPVKVVTVGEKLPGSVEKMEASHPYLLQDGETLNEGGLVVTWVPKRGMEGQSFDLCLAAQDSVGIMQAPQTHVCRGGERHLFGCAAGRAGECPGGRCEAACFKLAVQRCEYCIKGDDTLVYMMRQYGFETNWLRLWTLNSYQGAADPAYLPGAIFPPADRTANTFISNPDVLRDGMNRIYVGPIYAAGKDDTLQGLAVRFRTTVRALMSMNPDVSSDEVFATGMQQMCVAPCTTVQE